MNQSHFLIGICILFVIACAKKPVAEDTGIQEQEHADTLRYEEEKHIQNIRQLTFGGDNAEAYWSFDGNKLTFQATRPEWNASCDQIFVMDIRETVDTAKVPDIISTGLGRTTCSYFMPGDSTILFASTHKADNKCPPSPERTVDGHYVWPIYESFDI